MDQAPTDDPTDELTPEVDATVRRLLAGLPDPGPMPTPVVVSVGAALTEAARLRIHPGPLSRETVGMAPGTRDTAAPIPLLDQRRRPRPALALAAVAAAAALVVVGGSALHLTKRPLGAASVGNAGFPSPGTPGAAGSRTPGSNDPALHIQLSRTDYAAATLPALARDLADLPDAPVQVLAAESPLLGPIATQVGLRSCLDALGVSPSATVHADLATYAGEPAAVIMTSSGGADAAYVVGRECSTGRPALVAGPVPVP